MTNTEINKEKLIRAISKICEGNVVLKENIMLSELLELKKAVSPINNLITKKLTKAFIRCLFVWGKISEEQKNSALEILEKTNVNANGYDFVMNSPDIVAEIKGNIPYKGDRYGEAQIYGIKKDLDGLRRGKAKSKILPKEYVKFMVVLDAPDSNAREAMKSLTENMTDIKLVTKKEDVDMNDTGSIHVVFIS